MDSAAEAHTEYNNYRGRGLNQRTGAAKGANTAAGSNSTHRHSELSFQATSMTAPRHSHDSSRTQPGNHARRSENAQKPKSRTGIAKRTPHRVTHGHSELRKGRNMRRTSTRKNDQFTPTTTNLRCQSSKVEAYKFQDTTDSRTQRNQALLPQTADRHSGLIKEVTYARRRPP